MNRDDILNMPAGREMDKLIAEKIMGVKLCKHEADEHGKCIYCGLNKTFFERISPPRYYSTNIAAAWEVVEKMRLIIRPSILSGKWEIGRFLRVYLDGRVEYDCANTADTAPHAICRAALLATLESG